MADSEMLHTTMKRLIPYILILIVANSCFNRERQLTKPDLLTLHYLEAMLDHEESRSEVLKEKLIEVNSATEFSEISKLTDTLITVISITKEEMINRCGGRDESFNLNEPYSSDCVGNFFINMKYGEELQMHLSNFEDFLIEKNIDIKRIALDANQIEEFEKFPYYLHHDFSEYNFGNTTLTQALVRLAIFELNITSLQTEYLSKVSSM